MSDGQFAQKTCDLCADVCELRSNRTRDLRDLGLVLSEHVFTYVHIRRVIGTYDFAGISSESCVVCSLSTGLVGFILSGFAASHATQAALPQHAPSKRLSRNPMSNLQLHL